MEEAFPEKIKANECKLKILTLIMGKKVNLFYFVQKSNQINPRINKLKIKINNPTHFGFMAVS